MSQIDLKIKEFLKLHDHRVNVYTKFNLVFKKYLEERNFTEYDIMIKGEITPQFSEISQRVIKIEEHFKSVNRTDLANIIREIQNLEQSKLKLTIEEQLLKKTLYIDESKDPEIPKQIKQNLQNREGVIVDINNLIQDLKEELDEE